MGNKKVFVSGCYDMLHSGHVAFFEEAARYGDLEYCLSEIRRLLKNTFTTREIDNLIYHGAL